MRVNTALLCNYAEVRENLLYLVSGGITRIYRTEYPSPLNVCLALVIELHRTEREKLHELLVDIIDEDGKLVAKIQGGFQQTSGEGVEFHEATFMPVVFDLRNVTVEHAGWYETNINVDGNQLQSLRFRLGPPPIPV